MTQRAVLFLIGSLREGGAEGQCLLLARELQSRGWRVAIMLLRDEGVRRADAEAARIPLLMARVPVFRPRWHPGPWLGLVAAWWHSRRMVREFAPDIVHSWLFWAHLWGALLMPLAGPRPVFITGRRQTWSDSAGRHGLLARIQRCINRRTDAVLSNSRRVAISVRRREGLRRGRPLHGVIYNGLPPEAFAAEPITRAHLTREFPALAGATAVAVTVANLLPHKGYDVLVAAWAVVVRHHPGARVLCIGSDGGIQRDLESECARLGIAGGVVFAGLRRDVPRLLPAADIAVHASHDEGFSNAVLEYMAGGLATVATDVGGNAEALGAAGIVVPAGDAPALAAAVVQLLDNPLRRSALGAAAARRARKRFTTTRMVERHVAVYEKMLK